MDIFIKIFKLIGTPIIYAIIGAIIYTILKKVINNIFKFKNVLNDEAYKKNNTIRLLLLNVLKYLIIAVAIIATLPIYGINIQSLVAGLGILSLVFGLAFQDLIKDFLAGIAIIAENQYALGDIVEISGFKGEVISLGLKTTKLKNYKGAVKIIANRNIIDIINYSLENSLATVDIFISYESNLDDVEKVLILLAKKLTKVLENIIGEVKLLGITDLKNSSIIYQMSVETKPTLNYEIERILRKEIKEALEKAQIKIPYPKIEVHDGR